MSAPERIPRAVVRHLTGLRDREIDVLTSQSEFPSPALEDGREMWSRREVIRWIERGQNVRWSARC